MSFTTYFRKDLPTVEDPSKMVTVELQEFGTLRLTVGSICVEMDIATGDDFIEGLDLAITHRYIPPGTKRGTGKRISGWE